MATVIKKPRKTTRKTQPPVQPDGIDVPLLRVSRRGLLRGAGVASGAAALGGAAVARAADGKTRVLGPKATRLSLDVNGKVRTLTVEPRVTLLRALRNHLDLTGTKQICDRGACGGCSVILDGKLVNSCLMLAVDAAGKKIETVEGFANGNQLHPVQEAFCAFDALQCGFCTPGLVVASKNLCDRAKAANKKLSLDEIKEELSGNICRCGTYNRVFAAVQQVANGKVGA